MRRITALFAVLAAFSAPAQASKWMVGGSALVSRPDDGKGTYFSRLGYGAGLLFSAPISRRFELELDGFYFHRAFGAGTGANTYKFSGDFFEIPLLLRVTFFDLLSFGAGGYYAPFLGKLHVETSSGSADGDYVRRADYGYLLSARVGGTSQMPVFLEYRYAQGLPNIASSGTAKYFEIQFSFGVPLNSSR